MSDAYLRMVGIQKHFPGVQALKGVDLEAFPGEALALIGANGAGKSTLMNILGGVVKEDNGQIYLGGRVVDIRGPLDAAANGIAFVHQEMALLPTMTITDNLFITNPAKRNGLIDYKTLDGLTTQALARLGYHFAPRTKIRDLSPGDRQIVEITRALLTDPKVIIFDEPTSSLTSREKKRLFDVIAQLKARGTTIIYITHLLDEVFNVCERAVVLRNGETVGGGAIKDLTYADIVGMMIGGAKAAYTARQGARSPEVVLKVEGLSRKGVLHDIGLELHRGEVLGLWGLLGSGRTELARAIVGLDPIDGGRLEVNTGRGLQSIRPANTGDYIGIVTENRRDDGLLLPMSVKSNMSLANLRRLMSRVWPFIDGRAETAVCQRYVGELGIKVASLDQAVATLSGGNQQKVVVGRWLQKEPIIYIMDEPTRGLDVGAKADIHAIIGRLAEAGAAILVIMSDIDEIMGISHRYLVTYRGRIVADLPAEATKNELMTAAAGVQ